MKRVRSRIATTHVDLHRERFTREALADGARQISEYYIPILWNHDIRVPPIGRTVSAEVVELPDGEYALDTVGEYWEERDNRELLSGDGRSLRIRTEQYSSFGVRYDLSFRDDDGQALVRDLSRLAGTQAVFDGKKAAEPISVLVIASGIFALGTVARGFLGRLGSDLYDALKDRLKDFFARNPARECIVDFEFLVRAEGQLIEVHVLVDKADPGKIEEVLGSQFAHVDSAVRAICNAKADVSRVVFEWRIGEIDFRYGVTTDCVPFLDQIVHHPAQSNGARNADPPQ